MIATLDVHKIKYVHIFTTMFNFIITTFDAVEVITLLYQSKHKDEHTLQSQQESNLKPETG